MTDGDTQRQPWWRRRRSGHGSDSDSSCSGTGGDSDSDSGDVIRMTTHLLYGRGGCTRRKQLAYLIVFWIAAVVIFLCALVSKRMKGIGTASILIVGIAMGLVVVYYCTGDVPAVSAPRKRRRHRGARAAAGAVDANVEEADSLADLHAIADAAGGTWNGPVDEKSGRPMEDTTPVVPPAYAELGRQSSAEVQPVAEQPPKLDSKVAEAIALSYNTETQYRSAYGVAALQYALLAQFILGVVVSALTVALAAISMRAGMDAVVTTTTTTLVCAGIVTSVSGLLLAAMYSHIEFAAHSYVPRMPRV